MVILGFNLQGNLFDGLHQASC
jgi:hypothetical protein